MVLSKWHKELSLYSNDPTVAFDCWDDPHPQLLQQQEVLEHTDRHRVTDDHDARRPDRQGSGLGEFINMEVSKITMPERKQIFTSRKDIVDLPTSHRRSDPPCLARSAMGGKPTHRARLHFASYMASGSGGSSHLIV